jgi:transcriptional regulator with XRE-family HTH domain
MVEGAIPSWAKALTVLRLSRRWHQSQLARAAGLSLSAISRYESAKRRLTPEVVRRLLSTMGYPPHLWERARSFVASAGAVQGGDPAAAGGDLPAGIETIAAEAGRWMEELVRDALSEAVAGARQVAGCLPASPPRQEEAAAPPVAEALAILRALRDWGRRDLARAVSKPEGTLANYEYGKSRPSLPTLRQLLAAMGVSLATYESTLAFVLSARDAHASFLGIAGDTLPSQIEDFAAQKARRFATIAAAELKDLALAARLLASRDAAPRSWAALSACPEASREGLVRQVAEFQTPGFCELLCQESLDAAGDSARRAKHLSELAVAAAERASGTEGFRSRLRAYAALHLANALRVAGNDLPVAGESFERALADWHAGAADDHGLLNAARVLSLESSLRRAQRRLPEALAALDEGLRIDRWGETAALLLGKARALVELGEFDASIAQLRQAAACIDGDLQPRKLYVVENLWVLNLCHLRQYAAAELRLPRLRQLAKRNRLDLLRVDGLAGKIAAGLGRPDEALALLTRVRDNFVASKDSYVGAVITLEMAEVHATLGHAAAVKVLARESAPIFRNQRVHREARRALALFCQAAEEERASGELLRSLITYLCRARHDPHLRLTGPPSAGQDSVRIRGGDSRY